MLTIKKEFYQMLDNGIYPVLKFPMHHAGKNTFLFVYLSMCEKGLQFSFNLDGYSTAFETDIITVNEEENIFILPFDQDFNPTLDDMLLRVKNNIQNGLINDNFLNRKE